MTVPVLGGVLVGGRSRRMGRPKQLVEIGGIAMIETVVAALGREVDEVVLLGAGPVPAELERLTRVADADGCRGPMAGILGAMRAEPEACWVIAPCDLPLLRPQAVRWLVSRRRAGTWAMFPSLEGFVEPLLALYEPEARVLLEEAAAAGEHALHLLAADPRVAITEPPKVLRRCWFSVNTPQELVSLRAG
jgi:glutamate dehydrogenase (NADP+)/cyclic pyranopterin phosphate synthase/molybdopterin-guanine dinucleotide biosynthesis protein A